MISDLWFPLDTFFFVPVIWYISFLGFIGICIMKRRIGFTFEEKNQVN